MGKPTGFIEYDRKDASHRDILERINDFKEIDIPLSADEIRQQAARCMDCGVPFCHGFGCPINNRIPDFNDMIYRGNWEQACKLLHSTNNFPEITGRVCPALCESACTLSINNKPVSIKQIELQIVERGFAEGWIKPLVTEKKTGKKVAVIGSGPAGLTVAQQLARAGHRVVLFEKNEKIGGLLRYGIPDFKLDKSVIERRLEQLAAEGVEFQPGVNIGQDMSVRYLQKRFDCVCLTMGAGHPRDLSVPGRGYENIFYAMDYLQGQNKLCSAEGVNKSEIISAKNKVVVVIGGGDTGSDCVGTARRQGAKEIYQFEILPKPQETRPQDTPWPTWPRIMRTSSSHQEGCDRRWSVVTKQFTGVSTRVNQVHCAQVEWTRKNEVWDFKEIPGSEFAIQADIVLLALGFEHVEQNGLVTNLGLKLDKRGNILTNNYQTSSDWIFAAGDSISGASLVVRAIDSGRKASNAINNWLG